ncbi:M-phase phosphoprotein 8 [Entomophthora muscae]|uniref:M-phase phosphoprotein 8 n=1 Tax=Entomophthora muscae TaxID=34485 RepID=A0ACC2TQU9_9FUNG|nr:M-phase phosphoprotein 8 [Entomophthora muscae]
MGTCSPTNGLRQTPLPLQIGRAEEYKVEYINGNRIHYQKPQYYVKWKGYLLEESTWEPLSSLANAQEAVQLYLNKKVQKRGPLGKEGDVVKIDNSLPQETWAQGWDSNPEPTFLRAVGPMDQGPARLHFFGIKPLQAEAPAKS